jgi:hypothetical protein
MEAAQNRRAFCGAPKIFSKEEREDIHEPVFVK